MALSAKWEELKPKGKPAKSGFVNAPKKKAAGPAFPPVAPVALGWARLESETGLRVECLMGPAGAKPTDGYGGFEEVARPHKKPIIDWPAGKPYRMSVQLHLDGFFWDASVEPGIQQLEQMARRGDGDQPPPRVRCTLPGGRPRSPSVKWWIEDLDWGDGDDERAYNGAGQHTRQRVTVSLVEAVEDVTIRPAKNARAKSKKGGTYTVKKKGESLREVAAKLKVPVAELKKLNNVRDVARDLKVGTKLKLPK